jgi:hypothetical protein
MQTLTSFHGERPRKLPEHELLTSFRVDRLLQQVGRRARVEVAYEAYARRVAWLRHQSDGWVFLTGSNDNSLKNPMTPDSPHRVRIAQNSTNSLTVSKLYLYLHCCVRGKIRSGP